MNENFKKIYHKSIEVINWLESTGFLGGKKAGDILLGAFIVIGGILYSMGDVSKGISSFFSGLFIIITYTVIFVLSLNFYWIKPPKIIRKNTENPAQLFDRFSHLAYLYGIFIYSFFASIFIFGIVFAIGLIFSFNWNLNTLFYHFFFSTAAVFTVFYFMYHVSIKNISTKVIKARIRLYIAVLTTITAGLFGLALKEIVILLIAYLGIGLAWLSFFVEKIESEQEMIISLKQES